MHLESEYILLYATAYTVLELSGFERSRYTNNISVFQYQRIEV